ncbi:MAG TPA: DUF5317 family protein [bacterium]|nr:DUF5317 family protein [bacterium]
MLAALTGVGIGWARGGCIRALGSVPLKNLPFLGIAVVLVLVARAARVPLPGARALLAAGDLGALVVLWRNRRLPWMSVLFIGLALNTLVMLANGGRMPVTAKVLGLVALGSGDPWYTVAGPDTRWALLGDVLPVRIGGLGAVLSVGDLLMAIGLAGFVARQMRREASPRRAGRHMID